MVDLSDHKKNKLNILYKEKKYLELEKEIESIKEKDRSSLLITLLGVSKFFKKTRTRGDLKEAMSLFNEAYKKDQSKVYADGRD